MRILLVEDDPKISSFVKIGLESKECIVDTAYESTIAEKLVFSRKYNKLTPVIMFTSLDSVEDKLTGFDCGADDYLVKPFSFQELFARIKALVRRNKEAMVNCLLYTSDLELDSIAKKVRRDDKEINLTATEYKILE